MLLVRQRADLDVAEIRPAADVLEADKALTQSVLENIIGIHVDIMDESAVEGDA